MKTAYLTAPLVLISLLSGQRAYGDPQSAQTKVGPDILIDDRYSMAKVNYGNLERQIYKTIAFYEENHQPPYDPLHFAAQRFYYAPLVIIDREEITSATRKKLEVSNHSESQEELPNFYEMEFTVHLADSDEFCQLAAAQINRDVPSAKMTPDRIVVIPYSFIQIVWRSSDEPDSERRVLRTYPVQANARPTKLNVGIRGTKEFLDEVAMNPKRIRAEFFISGFQVKEDDINLSLSSLVTQGYARYLQGLGKWEELESDSVNGFGGSLNVGPIQIGGAANDSSHKAMEKCYVTRNQARAVLEKSCQQIKASIWKEIKDDKEKDAMIERHLDEMLEKLLAKSGEVSAEIAQKDGKYFIEDESIRKDLHPDTLAHLDTTLKHKQELKNNSTTEPGGIKAAKEDSYISDPEIDWKTEGTTYIPKSIHLNLIDNRQFVNLCTLNYVYAEPERQDCFASQQATIRFQKEVESTGWYDVTKTNRLLLFFEHNRAKFYIVDKTKAEKLGPEPGPEDYIRACWVWDRANYLTVSGLLDLRKLTSDDEKTRNHELNKAVVSHGGVIYRDTSTIDSSFPLVPKPTAKKFDDECWFPVTVTSEHKVSIPIKRYDFDYETP